MSTEEIKARILFSGTGDRMIDNVVSLVSEKNQWMRCQPTETELHRAMEKFKPHVIVVCLQNETRDLLRVYEMLYSETTYVNRPVIVIGYEEDCTQFCSRLPIRNLKIFHRPLNREAFLETLWENVRMIDPELALTTVLEEPAKPKEPSRTEKTLPEERKGTMEKAKQSPAAPVHNVEDPAASPGRKNILVVDDDVRMLNVIKLYLQEIYEVTVVPSGKLALKYLAKKQTDLVLLDYLMPEMTGPEVLKSIREGSHNPNVPVVFLTGVSDKDLVLRGLELRPTAYLLKPVSRETLLEKVTEIILGL